VHKRQFIPDERIGHYELLKWRSHAIKFNRFRDAQMKAAIGYAIQSRRGTTSHERNRAVLRNMLRGSSLFTRLSIWIRIAVLRLVIAVRKAVTSKRPFVGYSQPLAA